MSSSAPTLAPPAARPARAPGALVARASAALVGGTLVAVLGVLVLLGWAVDSGTLETVGLPGTAMRPLTALCLVLVGGVLVTLGRPSGLRTRRAGVIALALVTVLAGLSLLEHILGRSLGVDELLSGGRFTAPAHGRMAFDTALSLVLLAPALIAVAPGQPLRRLPPAQVALLASSVLGLVTLSGYLVGTIHLAGGAHASQPALHSSIAILVAALAGLTVRPRDGLVAPLTASTAAGSLLRNLLPPLLIAPLLLGALRYQGERSGLYGRSVGIWLMVLAVTAVLMAVLARAAVVLERSDVDRRRAQTRLSEMVDSALNAFIAIDPRGLVVEWNTRAEEMFGWSRAEAVGLDVGKLIVPDSLRDRHDAGVAHFAATGEGPVLGQRLELPAQRRDGQEFPVEIIISGLSDGGAFAFLYDISPRVEARTALESKSAELERSNAELEQFAYVASHDLAEPLRVVSGFAQLLQRRYAGQLDERADTYIEQTVAGTVRMRSLIEDLLAYSRVGRGELHPEDVPLSQLVEDARAGQATRIAETGASVEVLSELPVVRGERTLIGQLMDNLIGNGLKYAGDAPPRVEVFAAEEPGRWRISVRDHGIGIASEYRERVFKMFQRLHTRDEYEGTGIGLAICRRVVERHGGEIGIDDTPGGGATFSFTLPRED